MNDNTYNILREAGYPPQTEIRKLLDMLRGLRPEQCTRELLDDLHAQACEVNKGIQGLTEAVFTEAQK